MSKKCFEEEKKEMISKLNKNDLERIRKLVDFSNKNIKNDLTPKTDYEVIFYGNKR